MAADGGRCFISGVLIDVSYVSRAAFDDKAAHCFPPFPWRCVLSSFSLCPERMSNFLRLEVG